MSLTLSILALPAVAQVSLTLMDHWQLTPTAADSGGVFCRTFYHPGRQRFYVVYAGRPVGAQSNEYFRWEEYSPDFVPTGSRGTLAGFLPNVGDFAMLQVGTSYYHITGAQGSWAFRLSKYDEDFNLVSYVNIPIDSSDSKADMMLNYANGRLIIGAFHQQGAIMPTMPDQTPQWRPVMHVFEYDTSLVELAAPHYLAETFTPWGGSCISRDGFYEVVTFDHFRGSYNPNYFLSIYRYSLQWTFIDSMQISEDGQWSQGVLWDGDHYYVAYHSGRNHRSGNITVGIYNADRLLVYDTVITANAILDTLAGSPALDQVQYNANRPALTRVDDILYVSYDQDDYTISDYSPGPMYHFGNRWQAHVSRLRINGLTGIKEKPRAPALAIYPNPAQTDVRIHCNMAGTLQLADMTGRVVYSTYTAAGMRSVSLEGLGKGLYIVSLIDGSQSVQRLLSVI